MNLLAGVADEIAEFKTKDELEKASKSGQGREPKQSAEGVDKMLRSSGRSRFPEVFKAIYLSWTRFKGDYIEKMHEEGEKALAKNPAARWYISHKATWEANPSKKRSDFDDDYESDEIGSMAKYECRPPDARDRFFRNLVALGLSFPERQHNPITYSLVEGQDPDNPEQYGWQAEFAFADDFMPQRGAAYAVHIDLAHTSDKAGWAMSHVSGYRNRERENDDDKITRQAVVTLDAAMRFSQGPHGEIELRWARQLVFRLLERRFRIVYVTFDGWQSVDSIQTINARIATRNPKAPAEKKRVAENYSLDRNTEGYDTLKSMVYAGLYQGYRLPTVGEGPFEQPCIWWKELKALERQGGLATRARSTTRPTAPRTWPTPSQARAWARCTPPRSSGWATSTTPSGLGAKASLERPEPKEASWWAAWRRWGWAVCPRAGRRAQLRTAGAERYLRRPWHPAPQRSTSCLHRRSARRVSKASWVSPSISRSALGTRRYSTPTRSMSRTCSSGSTRCNATMATSEPCTGCCRCRSVERRSGSTRLTVEARKKPTSSPRSSPGRPTKAG
jgi:hypothetical protein